MRRPSAHPVAALALPLLLCMILLQAASGQNDEKGNFPVEIVLDGGARPSGIVAGRETELFVATVGGQLFRVDVQSGAVTLINRGGDGQALAGLCTDERGAGTLYAAGRDSGRLYAFSRDGNLQRIYQITNASTAAAPHFIADCITTRYRLLITDAFANAYYWLPLVDKGPALGLPVPLDKDYRLQGFEVRMRGEWTPPKLNTFGAFGIEWTGKWNETAYVMHSSSGQLFAFDINSRVKTGAPMVPVTIEGNMTTFPGALGILFDSTNELVMYITMPTTNSIAVIEFDYRNKLRAKYIRSISALLMHRPVMVGEYGDFIYPISGQFEKAATLRENATYVIPKVSRHKQDIADTVNTTDPFTTVYDGVKHEPEGKPLPIDVIQKKIRIAPRKTGVRAEQPVLDRPARRPRKVAPTPSSSPPPDGVKSVFADVPENDIPRQQRACFPGVATVLLENGVNVPMTDVRIGDRVQVGVGARDGPVFSAVYMFSHRDELVASTFVQVTLSDGRSLRLSPGHYMHLNDKLVAAGVASIGDVVSDGTKARIVRLQRVQDVGLYNPQTIDGSIVVNQVLVSTYTTAVHPAVATSALGPFRLAHSLRMRWLQRLVTSFLTVGSPKLVERFVPSGVHVH